MRPGDPADLGGRVYETAVGGYLGDRDQPDIVAHSALERADVHGRSASKEIASIVSPSRLARWRKVK